MAVTSPTDDELREFLADSVEPPPGRFVLVCRRQARAVVEELLERRASDRQMWEHLRQINAEEGD